MNDQPLNASQLAHEAEHRADSGDTQGASALAHKALSLQPSSPRARRVYARIMIASGLIDRALKITRRLRKDNLIADAQSLYTLLIEARPQDTALLCEAAELLIEVGDETNAKRHLTTALKIQPAHHAAATMLARLMMGAGEFDQALRWWTKLWRVDHRDVQAAAGSIVCAVCLERTRLANRMSDQLRLLAPVDRRQQLMGQTWRMALKGRLKRQAVRIDRVTPPRDTLSVMLAEAADDFQTQLHEHPDYADLHYHAAICREAIGQTHIAATHFDQALAINPGYVDALRQRLTGLLRQQNLTASRALLNAAHQRDPLAQGILDLTLVVMILDGSPEQALRYMTEKCSSANACQTMAQHVHQLLQQIKQHQHAEVWQMTCYQRLNINLQLPFTTSATRKAA